MGQLEGGDLQKGEKKTQIIMEQLEDKMAKNTFRPLLSSENQNIRLRPDRTDEGFVWERGKTTIFLFHYLAALSQ